MNKFARWFRWAVFVGILQDWFFALPGIFIPNAVLGFHAAWEYDRSGARRYSCGPKPVAACT